MKVHLSDMKVEETTNILRGRGTGDVTILPSSSRIQVYFDVYYESDDSREALRAFEDSLRSLERLA